jgi:hypothetical protein
MYEQFEQDALPAAAPDTGPPALAEPETNGTPAPTAEPEVAPVPQASPDTGRWHAEAGRKGARRVHELIEEGKLYEKEHGLKRGRQRLRQLIELGKLYEQEHGLRPARRRKRGERLSRLGREELLETFLQCLLRLAKPSFRGELRRLIEALLRQESGHAA